MIGYTQGRFDVVHHGHVTSLMAMRGYLGKDAKFIVGVATDEFCREWKGVEPKLNWHERATVIRHLDMVDMVIPYVGYADLVYDRIGFDVFFCTEELFEKDFTYYANKPFKTVYFPRTPGISSTMLKGKQ